MNCYCRYHPESTDSKKHVLMFHTYTTAIMESFGASDTYRAPLVLPSVASSFSSGICAIHRRRGTLDTALHLDANTLTVFPQCILANVLARNTASVQSRQSSVTSTELSNHAISCSRFAEESRSMGDSSSPVDVDVASCQLRVLLPLRPWLTLGGIS